MTIEELEKYFIELIDLAEKVNRANDEKISEALYELSDRQWHTYEMLKDTIKERIENWIGNTVDTKIVGVAKEILEINK